jgi:hypothetical protein
MRLQLTTALALVVAARAADADPRAEATVRVYSDDDDITVVSPSVGVETALGDTTIDADMSADAVTGASIDVMTSASPRPVDERRVELGLAASRSVISASVRGSHENDYDSVRGIAGLRFEVLDRRVTLDGRYIVGFDDIGSATDRDFHRTRSLHQPSLDVTVVVDPRTLVDVVVEASSSSGYHASPYRRVPLVEPAAPQPIWLDEVTPERRRFVAAAARVRRAIGETWFASLAYRSYADDWSISSHTATLDVRRQLGDRLLCGATARGYVQDGADFYRAAYVDDGDMPALRTRDRVVGPMRTAFASLTADRTLDEANRWHAVAAAGVLASWFPEFPLQRERRALILTLSLSMSFGGEP